MKVVFGFEISRDKRPAPVAVRSPVKPRNVVNLDERRQAALAKAVRACVHGEMSHFLSDVEFRVKQAYEVERRGGQIGKGSVYAEDLNLKKHVLTGYTVTDNTPSAGSIAWASLHIVYNGNDYTITDGNTALKYAWFAPATSPTALQTSDSKPALLAADTLVFVNNGGKAIVAVDSAMPAAVMDNAIDSGAILAGAVGSTHIQNGAIIGDKIGSGAVTSGALASGAVTSGKIGSGAVGSGNIAANAVGASQIADSAVDDTKLASGAVTSTKIASNAVTAGKIASGAVGSTEIASGAVGFTQMAPDSIDSGNIRTGAVGSTQLGSGAITAPKLNLLRHVLY